LSSRAFYLSSPSARGGESSIAAGKCVCIRSPPDFKYWHVFYKHFDNHQIILYILPFIKTTRIFDKWIGEGCPIARSKGQIVNRLSFLITSSATL
jgi:hypothetical protein